MSLQFGLSNLQLPQVHVRFWAIGKEPVALPTTFPRHEYQGVL